MEDHNQAQVKHSKIDKNKVSPTINDANTKTSISSVHSRIGGGGGGSHKNFQGSVSIVTGGASGIGKALVEELANRGARAVIIVDRQLDAAEQVANTIKKGIKTITTTTTTTTTLADKTMATKVKTYQVDVRNFNDIQRVVTETWQSYGRIDYMFNNAGTGIFGPFEKIGVADSNYVLDVNFRGVLNGTHAVYPIMKDQGFGHIINTACIVGIAPSIFLEGLSIYAASKYAIVGMSTNLRVEAARHGVRVSVLCPGVVNTPLLDGGGRFGKSKEEIDKFMQSFHPLDPAVLAKRTLKHVTKNKAIMVIPGYPYKMLWFMNHMCPSLCFSFRNKHYDAKMKKMKKATTDKGHEKEENENCKGAEVED